MSPRSDEYKYMAIYNHLKDRIESGELEVGAKLPTEEQLVKQFQVSRITVVRALELLQQDSLIARRQGSGSFVRSRLASDSTIKMASFVTSFTGEGREGQLISGLEREFREHGYMLSVSNSHEDQRAERDLIVSLREKVQGIVLYASSSINNVDLFEELLLDNFPMVFLDRHPLSLPCTSIACDNFDGGYQIGRFFVEQGHDRVAFIYHNMTGLSSERDRDNGFMHALSEASIRRSDIHAESINGDDTTEAVTRIMSKIGTGRQQAPTAIFAVNDHLAMVVADYIEAHRDELPDDMLLAGFDDLIGHRVSLPFVTVRQEYTEMGRQAAGLLLEKIEHSSYLPQNIVVPITFVRYHV